MGTKVVLVFLLVLITGCTNPIEKKSVDNRIIDIDFKALPLKAVEKNDLVDFSFNPSSNDWIIYLLDYNSCIPCINEVKDFSRFIEREEYKFNEVVLLIGDKNNKEEIKRLIVTSEVNKKHIFLDRKYSKTLLEFKEQQELGRQLLFVSSDLDKVYYRSYLKRGNPSPESHKKFLVNAALKNTE